MKENGSRISRATIMIGENCKFFDLKAGLFCLVGKKHELFIKMKEPNSYANAIRRNGEFVLVPQEEDVCPVHETIEPSRPR